MLNQPVIATDVAEALQAAIEWRSPASSETVVPASELTVDFLDLAFDAHGEGWVLDQIRDRPTDAPFAYIVTPNVDSVVRLQRTRSDLWPVYRHAWMTLCDSRILGKLAARAGCALPVVPGSDLTADLLRYVIQRDDRIAILGGEAAAVATLADRYNLANIRHYNPPMGFFHDPIEVDRAIRFLVDSQSRYSFIAVGAPQQEFIAYRVSMIPGAIGIGFCIGASIDFLTGAQQRAPTVMQQMSLEWLYRLSRNPRRLWRRYIVEGPAIFGIFADWRRQAGGTA